MKKLNLIQKSYEEQTFIVYVGAKKVNLFEIHSIYKRYPETLCVYSIKILKEKKKKLKIFLTSTKKKLICQKFIKIHSILQKFHLVPAGVKQFLPNPSKIFLC